MTNTEKIIELTFRRQDFEKIYFTDSNRSLFWHSNVKGPFLVFLFFAISFIVSLTYSILKDEYIFLTVITFLGLLFASYIYYRQALHIWKWKRSINSYLSDLSRIRNHKLKITPNSISLKQDDDETIEKWSVITKATLTEDYVSFKGDQNYIFPKASMSQSDYNYLKDFVADKIKNGL